MAQPAKRKVEPPGTLINCGVNKYKIDSLLGQGGMGDVYKVHLTRDPKKIFAMKTESNDVDPINARLKVETTLFEYIRYDVPYEMVDRTHFLQMYDKGKTRNFKFYIMDIIGHSLRDIVRSVLSYRVPMATVIGIARQTIKAVQSLHSIGWLHRDLKPANFAVGLPPGDNVIYLIDFGTARKFREPDGKLRVPRASISAPFSLIYCSLRCHANLEQGRRDDLEAWLYMIIDIIYPPNITWWTNTHKDVKTIVERKRALLETPAELVDRGKLRVPQQFLPVITMINKMEFTDGGDFDLIEAAFQSIIIQQKLDMNAPLAWIGKKMPDKSRKKESAAHEESPMKKDDEKMERKKDSKMKNSGGVDSRVAEMEKELAKLYLELGEPKTPEEIREEVRRKMRRKHREAERDEEEEENEGDYSASDEYAEEERKNRKRKKVQDKLKPSTHRNEKGGKGRRNRDEKDGDRDEDSEGRDDKD